MDNFPEYRNEKERAASWRERDWGQGLRGAGSYGGIPGAGRAEEETTTELRRYCGSSVDDQPLFWGCLGVFI